MKKSLLALFVASLVSSTQAYSATVYDKDGTSLKLDGRIQSVLYHSTETKQKAGESDNTLVNSARFGIGGETKLKDFKFKAYTQWDMADGSKRTGDEIKARDQYLQVSYGKFGSLKLGRFKGAMNYVTSVTDVFDDYSANAQSANDERNSGRIEYAYSNKGFDAKVGLLTSNDAYKLENGYSDHKKAAVENGASIALGYTFDLALPLSVKAGYEFIGAQDDKEYDALGFAHYKTDLDKVNTAAASVTLGSIDSGLYAALTVNNRTFSFRVKDGNDKADEDFKARGFEAVVGYTFESGIGLRAGYNQMNYKQDRVVRLNDVDTKVDAKLKTFPVYAFYQANPNFIVWSEARFDATSDNDRALMKKANINTPYSTDKTAVSLGARYLF